MNPFPQRYQAYSDAALLDILDHPDDYTPEALAAAQAELQGRNLSEQALADARQEGLPAQQARQQRHAQVTKAKSQLATLLDTLNPIQSVATTAERWARWLSIAFVLLAIAAWYENFALVAFMLPEIQHEWDFYFVELLAPLVLLTVGAVLFAWRKGLGWHLMATYLVFATMGALGLIIVAWQWVPSGVAGLDDIFPRPSYLAGALRALLYGSLLWAVARPAIRARFRVSGQAAITTLTAFGVLAALVVAGHLFT